MRKKHFMLLLATIALIVNFLAWSALSPIGALYADELALSPSQLSLLLATPIIVASLGRIVLGVVTDKIGGRRAFIATSLLTAIPVLFLPFANNYATLLAVSLLLGVGGAAFVVGVPFVSAWFSKSQQGTALGVYSLGNAGTALAGFAMPTLVTLIGKSAAFFVIAGLLLFVAFLFWKLGREAPTPKRKAVPKLSAAARLRAAINHRMTHDLAVAYMITFGALVAFGVYLPILLKDLFGLSITDAALRGAGFMLLATLARPVGGWASDKIGGKNVILLSLALTGLISSFIALQTTLELHTTISYLSLAVALGAGCGAVYAIIGRRIDASIVGSVSGIVGAIGGLAGFIPPLILGVTYQYTHSYTPALLMLSVTSLCFCTYLSKRFQDTLYR